MRVAGVFAVYDSVEVVYVVGCVDNVDVDMVSVVGDGDVADVCDDDAVVEVLGLLMWWLCYGFV